MSQRWTIIQKVSWVREGNICFLSLSHDWVMSKIYKYERMVINNYSKKCTINSRHWSVGGRFFPLGKTFIVRKSFLGLYLKIVILFLLSQWYFNIFFVFFKTRKRGKKKRGKKKAGRRMQKRTLNEVGSAWDMRTKKERLERKMKTNEETIHLQRIVFLVKNVNSLRTIGKERRKWRVSKSI